MMDVYINDHLTMKLVCLPQHLTELVLGRLLTEQIITSSEDVDHIYICEYGKRAKVYLKNSAHSTQSSSDAFVEVTPTCCTGNHILNDYFVTSKEPQSLTPIFWKPEWIFHMADAFADGSPLHGITFATHSCILAQKITFCFPAKISDGTMLWIKWSATLCGTILTCINVWYIPAAEYLLIWL